MTQKDKQLLLKDLSARLPYGVIIEGLEHPEIMTIRHLAIISVMTTEPYKPYLRPMSSMTEEEDKEWRYYKNAIAESCDERLEERINELHDWFNANHFDYRGLIPMGLAIEVTEDNNPYRN